MRRIVVASGKGGVGKTSIVASLASKLSKTKKIVLVDADVDCPNDHLLLSIRRVFLEKVEQRITDVGFGFIIILLVYILYVPLYVPCVIIVGSLEYNSFMFTLLSLGKAMME